MVLFAGGRISNLTSIPMGSLNMYTRFASGITLQNDERKLMRQEILDNLDTLYWAPMEPVQTLVGVGGTARAFKKICHELYKVPRDVQRLDAGYLGMLVKIFKKGDVNLCRKIYKIAPERMLTIQPGLTILNELAKRFGGYLGMLVKIFKKGDVNLCRKIYKIAPERMLTIQPGLTILNELAKRFGTSEVVVSRYGVREGYLIEHVLKNGGDN